MTSCPSAAVAAVAAPARPPRLAILVAALVASFLLWGASAQELLATRSLYEGIKTGIFDAILDVRSEDEWNMGHIEQATLVAGLASTANFSSMIPILEGCEACTLVVTCSSGHRAAKAIDRLQTQYNFTGTLYNGLGVSQWILSGYPLVNTESVTPRCDQTCGGQQGYVSLMDAPHVTQVPTSSSPSSSPQTGPTPQFSLTESPARPTNPVSSMPSDTLSLRPNAQDLAILSTPIVVDSQVISAQNKASESSSSSSPSSSSVSSSPSSSSVSQNRASESSSLSSSSLSKRPSRITLVGFITACLSLVEM